MNNMNCTFKKVAIYTIASSLLLLSPKIASAISVEEVVNPRQSNGTWVTDMADILNNSTETKLNQIINKLEQKNGTEIAVVTVDNTSPAVTSKAFATELFNYWSIGKAETNNGVLFLISVGDRRVEIETGLGIEPILSNTEVQNIIDRKITPQFKKQNFDRGTLNGTQALIDAVDDSYKIPFGWITVFIGAGTSLVGIIKLRQKSKNIYINPERTNYRLNRDDDRTVCCAKCLQPMKKVKDLKLNKAQQAAKKIGSTSYRGYQCSNCTQATNTILNVAYMSTSFSYDDNYLNYIQANNSILNVAYTSTSFSYDNCSKCKELTIIRTEKTTKIPTYKEVGKKLIKRECHCCDYVRETTFDIPCLRQNESYFSNSKSRNSSSSCSNYYSNGGGSSGGGDFGGGSSNGGGAGGDW